MICTDACACQDYNDCENFNVYDYENDDDDDEYLKLYAYFIRM